MDITYDEQQLMAIFNTGTREGTITAIQDMRGDRTGSISALQDMRRYLEADEIKLMALTNSTLKKLTAMTDAEFDALDLMPDF